MAEQDFSPQNPIHRAAEDLVANRLQQARQDEVLSTYADLLDTIWKRLESTLGRTTVSVLLDRALVETLEHYPLLACLSVGHFGISLDPLREQVGSSAASEELPTLREALRELIVHLIDLLALLTGDIIVRRMLVDLEARRS